MFPVPLGETASWDLDVIERSARIAAIESSAAGLHWTFAPMVDIGRDARFGRVMEGAGEDPYLGSQVAAARVNGFQGDDLSQTDTIAATAKHFAGYGFVEAGRDYNTVDVSNSTLWNVILPPFKAAAEAGVATFMNAFNDFDGVPATGSDYLQNTVLKGHWDFQGLVVSDWDSIGEMEEHGYASDLSHAARQAINAGNDVDMESSAYLDHLEELITAGEVSEQTLDNSVRRVLQLKIALGLFEDPYRYADTEREKLLVGHADHHAAARDAARKSAVLLKNAEQILPLSKTDQTIAVIGPLADDKDSPLGNWRGMAIANSAVSLLEGIRAAVDDDERVLYAEGAPLAIDGRAFASKLTLNEDDRSGFAKAIAVAKKADIVVMALGEDAYQSGEGRSRTVLDLAGLQQELFDAVAAVNDQIVVVLMSGRPLVIGDLADRSDAVLQGWHAGSQAGHGIADVLFGDYNPSGKLPMSFPRNVGQLPLYYNQKNTGRPGPGND
ncbi:MAG: glycoside hydrolase family 3 N-terminal domain-containing protein, partial [Pseudomonadales bacterium]